jgi:hypothetical protein
MGSSVLLPTLPVDLRKGEASKLADVKLVRNVTSRLVCQLIANGGCMAVVETLSILTLVFIAERELDSFRSLLRLFYDLGIRLLHVLPIVILALLLVIVDNLGGLPLLRV